MGGDTCKSRFPNVVPRWGAHSAIASPHPHHKGIGPCARCDTPPPPAWRATTLAPCRASVSSQAAAECHRCALPEQQAPIPSPPYLCREHLKHYLSRSDSGNVVSGDGVIIGSGGINSLWASASRLQVGRLQPGDMIMTLTT